MLDFQESKRKRERKTERERERETERKKERHRDRERRERTSAFTLLLDLLDLLNSVKSINFLLRLAMRDPLLNSVNSVKIWVSFHSSPPTV